MSKCYINKKDKLIRREMLNRLGAGGEFAVPWRKQSNGKPDGTWKVCPLCGTITYVPFQSLPGTCGRETCRYKFFEVRRGKRN